MIKYKIFQVKNGEAYFNVRFIDIFKANQADRFDFEAYNFVYEGIIDAESREVALEELFRVFNIDHPEDFNGRSLSVSDVIQFNDQNGGSYQYFYCKSEGWEDVTEQCLGRYF